ncbi:putative Trk system potassium uptake protein TrkA homolog [groundwater metagenome]|uniref:Putative Trk system potassium uptake protein TrkA homolog n=1 Tax=groundwater metagenome TaxID=717931 RepID=A0A098ECE7_9ZZZZ
MSLYIIVGGGDSERELAKLLLGEGHDVVVVEKEKEIAEKLAGILECLVINGDAANLETLKDAKIEKADGIAILTNNDSINLMITQFAKKLNVKTIVVRVNDTAKKDFFNPLGLTAVISPTSVIALTVRNSLVEGSEKTLMIFGNGKVELMEIPLPEGLTGKKIVDLGMPEDTRVACIYRKGDIIIAHGNKVLEKGDVLVVITKVGAVKELLGKFALASIKNV